MTAQLLTSEISILIQESKRKNPDLRSAAEKSLNDLKALPRTSEAQIIAGIVTILTSKVPADFERDLKSRPAFVKPFLLACKTRSPKFAGSGVVGLQRLVTVNALHRECLADVLEAFSECSTLALDIQLKVLQALPSLLQNYTNALTGDLLLSAYQVCFQLYSSRTAVVSNTAAAALQQLVNLTFEKAALKENSTPFDEASVEVPIGDGTVSISGTSLDAYYSLEDICLLTEGQKAKHLPAASLAQNFGLEVIESILSSHADTVMAHPEQLHILRQRLMPLIIKILSEKSSFSTAVRTMRVLHLVLNRLLFALAAECEIALSLLNHVLDPDAAPTWKRAMCLEVYRSLHTEPALMRSIYAHFDEHEENRNIVRDHLGSLVRLASERPQVIGLGQQSSIPIMQKQSDESSEQAALAAGGLVGSIGASVTSIDINRPGISTQWSLVRTPCVDLLDKSDAPNLPATYIYSLALTCITRFSEGLARFLLPFTVPTESKSKRRQTNAKVVDGNMKPEASEQDKQSFGGRKLPVNPLNLKEHVLYKQISTSAHMVENCWPALLAASSTYLNASMDSEHYHSLIRSFQKFAQIAGLLDLTTPRDAFLTTLGKNAIPAAKTNPKTPQLNGRDPALREDQTDSERETSPAPSDRHQPTDSSAPTVTPRHLLCLRALLNLGIALGPVMKRSWKIILETLLQAEMVISMTLPTGRRQPRQSTGKYIPDTNTEKSEGAEDLGVEITAAETAASRLFESTSELPSEAFLDFVRCVCSLVDVDPPLEQPVGGLLSPNPGGRRHQVKRSVSGMSLDHSTTGQTNSLLIDKLDEVIRSNITRMLQADTSASGWKMILEKLIEMIASGSGKSEVRLKVADAYNSLVVAVAVSQDSLTARQRDDIRGRSLYALRDEISALPSNKATKSSLDCDVEIHRLALDALKSILDHCGDSLDVGWPIVLAIVNSIFEDSSHNEALKREDLPSSYISLPNPKLVRSAFGSLQFICSDFLGSFPRTYLLPLLDTLYYYCVQTSDLNISLTTATFFRNVSDFLQRDREKMMLDFFENGTPSNEELAYWAKGEDEGRAVSAMWVYLLWRLMLLSVDRRVEVRHSALYTLFRIFEACSDQLTTSAIRLCYSTVIVRILKGNVMQYYQVNQLAERPAEDTMEGWNETAVIEVDGTSNLFSQWIDSDKADASMITLCADLVENYTGFLQRRVLSVSDAVFRGMSMLLAEFEDPSTVDMSLVRNTWDLWTHGNPASHADTSKRKSGNQDTLMSYLGCLHQVLRLFGHAVPNEISKPMLRGLKVCIVAPSDSTYGADVDRMTPVQSKVLEAIKSIPINEPSALKNVVEAANDLITLAYKDKPSSSGRSQTYVALSKAAMSLLEACVTTHLTMPHVNLRDLVAKAGEALAVPLRLKYTWKLEGKEPAPWSKATTTGLMILEASLPIIKANPDDEESYAPFWRVVVGFSDGIVSAQCDACSKPREICKDEEFDIEAFSRMQKLLVPALGSSLIPDTVRRKYSESLFENSLIHEPDPDDLAAPGQELLEGLRSTHIGRVCDLPASPRSKMCYLLLDELFSLVAVHDGSSERVRLAQAAAPYLILRTGLTLKAYIMDHPLRGRMPQPWSQKKEMLYILRKLVELDSEPKAIPTAPGITSQHKKHLHRLYGLVMKALKVAWRDEEMLDALRGVLDAVGDDFGI